jgi:hypothetical protein
MLQNECVNVLNYYHGKHLIPHLLFLPLKNANTFQIL